jgi:hypothetical protein
MQIKRNWIWIIALATAWLFDFLFWKQAPGISFFIFVVVCLIGGAFAAALSGIRPNLRAIPLALMILAAAAITFLRQETFTVACAVMLTLALMALLAATYRGGKWPLYSTLDYLVTLFRLGIDVALHPVLLPQEKKPEGSPQAASRWRTLLPSLLRGLVISVPILLLFAALLASADAVFGKWVGAVFNLENLPEYIFRLIYILLGAYLLVGVFLYALLRSHDEDISASAPARFKPFLGFVEAAMVLAGTDLLFLAFVLVQFRYFFGGAQNILVEGYTYSEYARTGFGELVAVAALSLLLMLALGSITAREERTRRIWFSALGAALVALVSVILVSALQRLLMYETAYGFTSLRMYTHIFILWLGLLLVAIATLEIAGRMRFFPLAALLTAVGFTLTLAILNVDNAIVVWNEARDFANCAVVSDPSMRESATTTCKLDTEYLNTLSDDAVPALLDLYKNGPAATRDSAGIGLSCRLYRLKQESVWSWQSFLMPRYQAQQLLEASDVSAKYPVEGADVGSPKAGGVYCWSLMRMD